MSVSSFDPKHPDMGWQTSVPEPFWVRKRVGWFRREWRAACYPCKRVFDTEDDYGSHYLKTHT